MLGANTLALSFVFRVIELRKNRYDSLPVSTMWQWWVGRSPVAEQAVQRIAMIYRIEREMSAEDRRLALLRASVQPVVGRTLRLTQAGALSRGRGQRHYHGTGLQH